MVAPTPQAGTRQPPSITLYADREPGQVNRPNTASRNAAAAVKGILR